MVGDFYFPIVGWTTATTAEDGRATEKLESFCDKHCLMQIVTEPTRDMNTIDLIFMKNEEKLRNTRSS